MKGVRFPLTAQIFVGMALSLQVSAELALFGVTTYTGRIVGISIIREIGPVLAAICFAGRVGAGMASELGSMALSRQVDVIRVFGIDPVKKLVSPRVLAAIIMLPVLTVIGDGVSLLGAYFVSVIEGHHSAFFYWHQIKLIIDFQNLTMGIVKPFAFGYIVAVVSCYTGLKAHGGAKGLRKATTTAVVLSIVSVIAADFVLTRIFLYAFGAVG